VINYGREFPPDGHGRQAEESPCPRELPGGTRDVGGDDIRRVAVQAAPASQTRSPFSASSEISACSGGGPSPAATSSAPSSLRSSATAYDS